MSDFIEIELTRDVLKKLGYKIKKQLWTKYHVYNNNKRVFSIDIPATYESEGQKYKITSIGKDVFIFTDFESINIPDTVTKIDKGAFSNCSLKSIVINSSK